MKHREFISTMKLAERASAFQRSLPRNGFRDCAEYLGVLPIRACQLVKFYDDHRSDTRVDWMGDYDHGFVRDISSLMDVSSKESARRSLVKRYRIDPSSTQLRQKQTYPFSKRQTRKLFCSLGLNWGFLDGAPAIHWNEV